MLRLLAIRDARRYLIGQTLSLFGDTALFLALAIWVKSLTGSNAAAGLVFFALALPSLGAPFAGLLVDRVRRRPLMIAIDLTIGILVLLLLLVHDRGQLWLLYVVAVFYGAAGSIFASAQSALLRTMLPEALLGEGNAALQTIREALRIIGPLTGAGLYAAFGGGAVAAIDAVTFAVSAYFLATLQVEETVLPHDEPRFLDELTAGVRYVVQTTALRQIVLTVGVTLLVVGFGETVIFAVVSQGLHRPASFLGPLSAVQGAGAIIGGLTATRLLRRVGDARLIAIGIAVFGLGSVPLASGVLGLVILGFFVAGAGLPWVIVGFGTAVQRRTPMNLQGRVYSAADMMVSLPQTISIAVGAGLSTIVDYRILIAVMAMVMVGCSVYLFTRRTPELPALAPMSEDPVS